MNLRLSRNKIGTLFLAALAAVVSTAVPAARAQELNVYSHRHYAVDEDINKLFTEKTGIKVNVQSADADQLLERIKSEGANSPADVFITVDAARMQLAKKDGLLQPVTSEILEKTVPPAFRDPENYWQAYTIRARAVVIAPDRVKADEVKTYEDLADPKFAGRLLVRSSGSGYNQGLLASIIAAHGEQKALAWAKGVVANMARPPQGGDRDQIKAVASGLADVAITNTYYFGLLLNSKDPAERAAAAKLKLVFPNQGDRGTHCNVGAAAILKHAKNVENAKKYLDFLVSPEVQKMVANGSHEFPVTMDLTLSPTHEKWGKFKADTTTFPKLGENLAAAQRLFDQAGWK